LEYEYFDLFGSNINLGLLSNPPSLATSSPFLQHLDNHPIISSSVPWSTENPEQVQREFDDPGLSPAGLNKLPQNLGLSSPASGTDSSTPELLEPVIQCPSDLLQPTHPLSTTEYGVAIDRDIESDSGVSNPLSNSTISSPQVGCLFQIRIPDTEKISQATDQQEVVPQAAQKLVPVRKRHRKEQPVNCPSCFKVFSRPRDLK
jgi:hypothetical protein